MTGIPQAGQSTCSVFMGLCKLMSYVLHDPALECQEAAFAYLWCPIPVGRPAAPGRCRSGGGEGSTPTDRHLSPPAMPRLIQRSPYPPSQLLSRPIEPEPRKAGQDPLRSRSGPARRASQGFPSGAGRETPRKAGEPSEQEGKQLSFQPCTRSILPLPVPAAFQAGGRFPDSASAGRAGSRGFQQSRDTRTGTG